MVIMRRVPGSPTQTLEFNHMLAKSSIIVHVTFLANNDGNKRNCNIFNLFVTWDFVSIINKML